jgi:AI-2 transport system permease protein
VNPGAARYSGAPVKAVLIGVYTISGLCAAMAGVMLTSYFTSARSDLGSEALLPIITAVVLGGASILGGSGTVIGTLLAGLVLGYLRQGLLALGVTSDVVPVVVGGLLVGIVAAKLVTADLSLKRRNRRTYRILKAVESMPGREGAS